MGNLNGIASDGASTDAERAENARIYERRTRAQRHADLASARGDLVAKYRRAPGSFPDGPDTKYDRWYRKSEWTDAGDYIGPLPCVRAANPDVGRVEIDDALPVDVTEFSAGGAPVTEFPADVTEKRRGPKPSGAASSAADRKRAERARKKDGGK